ncbi:hypothetical protein GW17_00011785 [Ensete ventricosum]|nr:hypothetical protein GW17_00011785 [Ensete ventricosum]
MVRYERTERYARAYQGKEEKTATKKSPPREILLIRSVVSRFSGRRRLRPLAKNATKKKPRRCLAVRGRRYPRFFLFFSLFLFLLPCFFFPCCSQPRYSQTIARLIPPSRLTTVEIDRYRLVSGGNRAKTTPYCSIWG